MPDVGVDGGTYGDHEAVKLGSRDDWIAVEEGDGRCIPGAAGQAACVEGGLLEVVEDLCKDFVGQWGRGGRRESHPGYEEEDWD